MFQTYPLDLHEIRARIASSLGLKDLASCAHVSQDWNNSFTPPLYNSVVFSKHGLSMDFLERNKHLVQHLKTQSSAYEILSSSESYKVISIMANSTIITLDLYGISIGPNESQAMAEALMTNSTLTTLTVSGDSIESNRAVALAEALKTNSTLTNLNLGSNSIGPNGAQVLAETLKANSTLTSLYLWNNSIGDNGAQALSDAIKINSTLITLDCRVPLSNTTELRRCLRHSRPTRL
ncbi:MAG: hypothetical protein JOS17DRAFT_844801 [Linnemannia elongata]|nr:MAG: hypothetical protein JOS17DRAFT_844801 [Linnemannia elongata]